MIINLDLRTLASTNNAGIPFSSKTISSFQRNHNVKAHGNANNTELRLRRVLSPQNFLRLKTPFVNKDEIKVDF